MDTNQKLSSSPSREVAEALHALAPGTEFNDKPERYFSLDVGKGSPKNAVTIRRDAVRVTFYVQNHQILAEANDQGLDLRPVQKEGEPLNLDKYACSSLNPAKVREKQSIIIKLLNESVRVIASRQSSDKAIKTLT